MLVHGAFVGGWIWEPLAERLEAAGHTVEHPDLPGSGEDNTPVAEVTLDAYADRICELLRKSPEPAVLVGTSMGGMVISQAAARCPEQVERLIYVAAFLPEDGQSLIDLTQLPEGTDDQVQANVVVSGEPPVATLSEEASMNVFHGSTSPEAAAAAVRRQRPQPVAPFAAPVALGDRLEGIARSYVLTTRDRAVPPALQRRMVKERGVTDVVELDTDHRPQLSATAELADALDQRARQEAAA